MSKSAYIGIIAIVLLGAIALVFSLNQSAEYEIEPEPEPESVITVSVVPTSTYAVIGQSVEGRDIEAYTFGTGDTNLLFVGGIHGGYEWNSSLLAYEFIDYFTENYQTIPNNLTIAIIPDLNPDGTYLITQTEGRFTSEGLPGDSETLAPGRFNANQVDLNRNFDCKWEPESTWRGQPVSAGTSAFSEPEAAALRDYVAELNPVAAVFWHSKANTVYASECENGVLPETLQIMDVYASAAEYNTQATFDAYSITGDAEGWLATLGIPAITVELETRTSIEWRRNLKGVTRLLNYYLPEAGRPTGSSTPQ